MLNRLLPISVLVLLAVAGCEDLVDQTETPPSNTPSGPVYPSMRSMRLPANRPFSGGGQSDPSLSTTGTRARNGGDADRGEPPLK